MMGKIGISPVLSQRRQYVQSSEDNVGEDLWQKSIRFANRARREI